MSIWLRFPHLSSELGQPQENLRITDHVRILHLSHSERAPEALTPFLSSHGGARGKIFTYEAP